LILDEITAFLSIQEVNLLKDVIKNVVSRGHSVLFVSHDWTKFEFRGPHHGPTRRTMRGGSCDHGVDRMSSLELIRANNWYERASTTAMKVAKASEVIEVTGLTAGSGELAP